MEWQPLGKVITIASQRKWLQATVKSWFKFELFPATAGMLEVSLGDGDLTIGTPIYTQTDRSPIALYLPTPSILQSQNKRLALQSEQRLKIRVYTLDIEPVETTAALMSNNISIPITVVSATVSTTLLEENVNRKGATIYNLSESILYIDFDSAVTLNNYAVMIPGMAYYEIPFNIKTAVSGIWSFSNGVALVREII